ncbi:MAG: tetratricopeptide (TPR) repeat protein [Verrucomicrobiales bacterium]
MTKLTEVTPVGPVSGPIVNSIPKRILDESVGYFMLEMFDDAWLVLDEAPESLQGEEDLLSMRIDIAIAQKKWTVGADLAKSSIELYPSALNFYLNGAFCIRRDESLESAYPFLLAARRACDKLSAIWHYNLACYEAQLGNLEAVGPSFHKAISMDPKFEAMAKTDPDLKPWLETL